MYRIFFLFLLLGFFSCNDSAPKDVKEINGSGVETKFNFIKDLKKDESPFNLDFSLEQKTSTSATLVMTLSLDSGDYVTSPASVQEFFGAFTLEFKDSTKISMKGDLIEFPPPVDLFFSFDDRPVKSYVNTTILSHSIEMIEDGDFEALGTVFFVLEPICYPYEISFVVSRALGDLSVKRLSIEGGP